MKKIGFLLFFSSLLFLVGCQSWNEDEKEKEVTISENNYSKDSVLNGKDISNQLSGILPHGTSYLQEIYQLIASGAILEEIEEENIPYLRDIWIEFSNPDSGRFVPSYRIGEYVLLLCGPGKYYNGNRCYTHENRLEEKIENFNISRRAEFIGIIVMKGNYSEKSGFVLDDTYENGPKGLLIKDGKLLLVTLDGNGAGSGEGMISVYMLLEDGTWELADCRYYLWDCTEEEQKADPNCILSPLNLERFEQYPLIACSDYDARDGEMEI